MISWLKELWRKLDPAWQHSLGAYAVVRIFLLVLASIVVLVYPGTLDPEADFRRRIDISAVGKPVENALWGVWLRFDTLWYIRYARDGLLPANHSEYRAFWPLYPWLIRWTAPLLGGDYLKAALVISNLALIAALVVFYRLAELEYGSSVARRGIWYMLLFPSALFYFAAYSEPLFLAFSLAAFYAARRQRWGRAGLWAGIAAMSRVSGAFVLPALGVGYVAQRMKLRGCAVFREGRWWLQTVLHAWPFVIMIAGVAVLPVYTTWFLQGGTVVAAVDNHIGTREEGYGLAFPWQVLAQAVRALTSGQFFVIQPFDLAFTLLFLALTVVVFLRLPLSYAVYMAVTMLVLVSRSVAQHPLIGASRYIGPLFPAYLFLGQAGQRPWVNRLILYPSLLILTFFAAEFMIGGFVG